ncbi:MAG: methionyl-tRNA formyltransferase [Pseudomonadota bacterium]|nr:methionyl-tRNA formyltransferase [Pseudomonadota bacterium]
MQLIFFGSSQFSVTALQALLDHDHEIVTVYTQGAKPSGRGHRDVLSPVHQYALEKNLTVRTPKNFRDKSEQEKFSKFKCDLGIVVAYGILLPEAILNIPLHGCINVHASLLPRWRGAAPIQRAILSGDKKTGVTIMQMNAELDAGDILRSKGIAISLDTNFLDLERTLSTLGSDLLIETINNLHMDRRKSKKQSSQGVIYAKKIRKNEGKIDWSDSAGDIERKIRALNPWPGVWFEDNVNDSKTMIKIHSAKVVNGKSGKKAGIVLDEKLTVACGNDALRILTLQRSGKRIMTVAEYLRGNSIPIGHQFC